MGILESTGFFISKPSFCFQGLYKPKKKVYTQLTAICQDYACLFNALDSFRGPDLGKKEQHTQFRFSVFRLLLLGKLSNAKILNRTWQKRVDLDVPTHIYLLFHSFPALSHRMFV